MSMEGQIKPVWPISSVITLTVRVSISSLKAKLIFEQLAPLLSLKSLTSLFHFIIITTA